jgi:hypothetical protein
MKSTRLFFAVSAAVALVAACSGVDSNSLGGEGGAGSSGGSGGSSEAGSSSGAQSSSGTTGSSGAASSSGTASSSSGSGAGSGSGSGGSSGSGSGSGSSSGVADSGPMRQPVPCGPAPCTSTCCFTPAPREAGPAYSCLMGACPAGTMQVCVSASDCASGETCRLPVVVRDGGTDGGADAGSAAGRCVMPLDAGVRG